MSGASPRRRYQFSLRASLVALVVAAVCFGLLGREIKFVRERKAMRKWLYANGGAVWTVWKNGSAPRWGFDFAEQTVPIWRRWMGDEYIKGAVMPRKSLEMLNRVKSVFPEAEITQAVSDVYDGVSIEIESVRHDSTAPMPRD